MHKRQCMGAVPSYNQVYRNGYVAISKFDCCVKKLVQVKQGSVVICGVLFHLHVPSERAPSTHRDDRQRDDRGRRRRESPPQRGPLLWESCIT